jgi:2-keto-3-deoxy-L-rhamnonate aldolase RhmA
MVDMEHNPLSSREASLLTHAIVSASRGKCKALIRVPSHGVEWIKWALDCGSAGILIPMVQSADEMELIIKMAVYPPRGQRSFGPAMAPFASVDPTSSVVQYLNETSKDVAVIPMIESSQGLEKAEEICAVDGVTAVFVGPADLRLSMGLAGAEGSEKVYLDALQSLVGICKRLGKPIGIFAADEETCRKRTADGFDYILLPGEAAMLVAGAKAQLEACRRGVKNARL